MQYSNSMCQSTESNHAQLQEDENISDAHTDKIIIIMMTYNCDPGASTGPISFSCVNFYRAMLYTVRRARLCHSMSSVRMYVCNVQVP